MERKLASVQRVQDIAPIPNADNIDQAHVMGWTVVVKKGEFSDPDLCVFFEIDSLLPETEWSEFMRPRSFRVKTAKLRGVLSQGLALSMDILEPRSLYKPGDDVTEELGVLKYEPPEPQAIDAAGPFPAFISKTDEIRLQSMMGAMEDLRGHPWYATEKIDGTSCTITKLDGEFTVAARVYAIKEANNCYWNAANRFELKENLPEGFAIQGEVCGPGIAKNRPELPCVTIRVFDVFDIKKGTFLDWDDAIRFCTDVGVPTVDELYRSSGFALTLDELLEMAKGKYAGTKNRREGIVVRPLKQMRSEALGGSRLSFKVLNNDFLLKDED